MVDALRLRSLLDRLRDTEAEQAWLDSVTFSSTATRVDDDRVLEVLHSAPDAEPTDL